MSLIINTDTSPEYRLISLLYATGIKWTLRVDEHREMFFEFGNDHPYLPDNRKITDDERLPIGFDDELAVIPGLVTRLIRHTDSYEKDTLTVSYPHPLGDQDDEGFFDRVDEKEYYRVEMLEEQRLYRNLLLADRIYITLHPTPVKLDEISIRTYDSHGRSCPIDSAE